MSRLPLTLVVVSALLGSCSRDLALPEPPGPGSLSGRVVLAEPGSTEKRPLAGAEVRVLGSGLATTTSPGGTFILDNLELTSGLLLVRVDVDGVTRQQVLQLSDYGTGPLRRVDVGDIVIGANARVRGKALRADIFPALGGHAGTTVFVPAGPFTAFTNDDGSYVLDQMPEGPVDLFIYRAGYEPLSLGGLRLRSGETLELRDATLTLATNTAPGAVKGSLAFVPQAAGKGDSAVRLVSTGAPAVPVAVGDDLTFTLASVPVGLYRLEATRSGFSRLDVHNVLVVSGRETNFGELTLTTAPPFDPGPPPVMPDAGLVIDAGTDAGTDAGIDAGVDAGTATVDAGGTFCVAQSDCNVGFWCDRNRCVLLCQADPECGFGRVCDVTATRTCLQSCQGQCPAGQFCAGLVCRNICDPNYPCPSGQKCNSGTCVPECMFDTDCSSAFLACDQGACRRNGQCSSDLDCVREQLCVVNPVDGGGQCGARPTDAGFAPDGGTWVDGGLVYPCSQPCHCRTGERCADGFCEPDVVPTRFVMLGADGGGTSASTPTGNLLGFDGGTVVVALLAADLWDLGTQALNIPSNTHVAGGFSLCGTNRWVRERSARTLITSMGTLLSSGGPGTVIAGGALSTPTLRSAISGVTIRGTGTNRCGGPISTFKYATEVRVEDVDLDLALTTCSGATSRTLGIAVEDSNAVTLRRVRLINNSVGGTGTPAGFLLLARSNGLAEDLSAAPFSAQHDFRSVEVLNPSSTTTLRRVSLERFVGRGTNTANAQVVVTGCADVPVVVEDLFAAWPVSTSANAGNGYGVTVDACNQVSLRRVTIDGLGHPGILHNTNYGVWLRNSGGTAQDLAVTVPTPGQSVATLGGMLIEGPRATWGVSRVQVSATGGAAVPSNIGTVGIRFGLTGAPNFQGPMLLEQATISNRGNTAPIGLMVMASVPPGQLAVTDSTIDVEGASLCGNNVLGVYLNGGAARFERNLVSAGAGSFASGLYAEPGSQVELYGNSLRVGPNSGTASCGALGFGSIYGGYALTVENGASVRAIGNTFDPGGQTGAAATLGVACYATSIVLASNIITSGRGLEARLLSPGQTTAPGVTQCFGAASTITNNYFVNSYASPVSGQERLFDAGVVLNGGVGLGNAFGGTMGCFAPPATLSDGGAGFPHFLAANSPCADRGSFGARNDGSTVTLDLFKRPRDGGPAPDIGAVEGP